MKLLNNLILVDETHPLNLSKVDILVKDSNILKIGESIIEETAENIEYNGEFVSPGWIDLHVHVFNNETDISVDADRVGVESGVVLICDAGSSGSNTIDKFYNDVKDKKTIVKSWINLSKFGLQTRSELKELKNISVEDTIQKINEYPDFIVGLKVRASSSVMGEDTVTPFNLANEVKSKTGKPIMVHIGNYPPTYEEVLSHLSKDDVITHCFHGKPGGILDKNNKVKSYIQSKRDEGIKYDVGHGQESFSYSVASYCKEDNFYPDSISSDLHKYNLDGPVYSLSNVVNKFLNLGFTLNEVINWVTINPANMIGVNDFGSLKNGSSAHLTIFKIDDEAKVLHDSDNAEIPINQVVKTVETYVYGKRHKVKYEN